MANEMRLFLFFITIFFINISSVRAIEVKHNIETSIGFFDACKETFSYNFYKDKNYIVKTSIETTGTFGALYPFKASYNSVGTFDGLNFKPQDYFYETSSRFKNRTKEIFYKDGIPQYRVSTKNDKKRTDKIIVDKNYTSSIDLLSVFGVLAKKINDTGKCDLEHYSFNGKRYSKSVIKYEGKERIDTGYYKGRAVKCRYDLHLSEDADAGFLLSKDVPVYFWVLKDKDTDAYFLAKIEVESTPFGKLKAITTNVEIKK